MPIKTEKGDLKPIIYLGAISEKGLLIVKYKTPPNPLKTGWWLPAPEIEYGQDPNEEAVALVKKLGLQLEHLSLVGIDSFIANDAWHLMAKYRAEVSGEVTSDEIIESRWVTPETLPAAPEFAHGNWEVELCRYFLGHNHVPVGV